MGLRVMRYGAVEINIAKYAQYFLRRYILVQFTLSENPKSRQKKLPKLTLCIFVTSMLQRNYIIKKTRIF